MKIKDLRQIIREEIKSVLSENQPAPTPTKPRETPGREVADPETKPGQEPKRRKLGNPNVKPAPKAKTKATVKEADMISKITQRFKTLKKSNKKMNELMTLDNPDGKKSDSKAKPLYTDKEIEAMTPKQAQSIINKGIWNTPANQEIIYKLKQKAKQAK